MGRNHAGRLAVAATIALLLATTLAAPAAAEGQSDPPSLARRLQERLAGVAEALRLVLADVFAAPAHPGTSKSGGPAPPPPPRPSSGGAGTVSDPEGAP